MFSVCGVKNLVQGTNSLFCSSVFRPACECFQPGQEEMDWHTFCSDVLPVLHSDVNLRI